jgi:hypothetical protein
MNLSETIKRMGVIEEQKPSEKPENDSEYNDEGGMALTQLKTAKDAVSELMGIIKKDDNLPEWVQSKLTKAVDYMDSVRDYLSSEEEGDDDLDEGALKDLVIRGQDLEIYAKKHGGIDKKDMMKVASLLKKGQKSKAIKLAKSLDSDPRDFVLDFINEEDLDEAKVRGKEVYDKTFANKKQADDFARKMGGRVKLVGRVFYVFKEEVELDEGKSSTGYELYHRDFSSAMKHAYDFAKKKYGITVNPKEIDDKVATGPRKPSKGKTNSYRLKGDKGTVQVQVANLDDKRYELNMYKEEMESTVTEEKSVRQLINPSKEMMIVNMDGKKHKVIVINKSDWTKYKKDGWVQAESVEEENFDAQIEECFSQLDEAVVTPTTLSFENTLRAVLMGELDEAYKTPEEARAFENGKKAAREGKKYQDNPHKSGTREFTAWSKGHNQARANKMGMKEDVDNLQELSGKEVAKRMKKIYVMKTFADKVAKMKTVTRDDLEKMLPDYIDGKYLRQVTEVTEGVVAPTTLSFEETLKAVLMGEATSKKEEKDEEGDELDPVNKKALKKKFADRKDKDIDNDGDVDGTDKYLHKKRKAISKAMKKDDANSEDEYKDIGKSGKQTKVDTKPNLDEAEMSDAVMKKREEIMIAMKKKMPEFKAKYGDRAKEVMYATATKMAQKQA